MIQSGSSCLNCFFVMLWVGLKINAEAYTWRGLFSIGHLYSKMNRHASRTRSARGDAAFSACQGKVNACALTTSTLNRKLAYHKKSLEVQHCSYPL